MTARAGLKYHHVGIPVTRPMEGEVYIREYKVYHTGYESSEFGIEWMRYELDSPLPDPVKTVPHVAFEVEDIGEAIRGKRILIPPNSPSDGIVVAFIEENGAPVEFLQFLKEESRV